MKANLMHADADIDLVSDLPAHADDLVQDLELDTLFAAMSAGDAYVRDIAKRTILCSLHDSEAVTYRQQVLHDCLNNPDTFRQMYAIADEAIYRERRIYGGLSRGFPAAVLRHSIEVMNLFVEMLTRLRDVAGAHADTFTSEGLTRLCASLQSELDDEYFDNVRDHLKQLKFEHGLLLSAELGSGNKAANYVLRLPNDAKSPWWKRMVARDRTGLSFRIADRDEAGANALSELRGRGVNLAANALAQSADHILSFFKLLKAELAFYIGALNLHTALTALNSPVTFPAADTRPAALEFSGLYDPCLRLTTTQDVVGNDLRADGTSLVMVTGANQGGKSTFLRSVGVAQLMFQCGMFVSAAEFRANLCADVFTHFAREEDAEMVSGKLDEELNRMSKIVDVLSPTSLVLCNESFAATNEREGSEIARHIIRALTEANIKVFFVTHLYDLAHSFYLERSANAAFLRAERGPDGNRSFRIVAGEPLPTSFGTDLYEKVFAPASPVEAANDYQIPDVPRR